MKMLLYMLRMLLGALFVWSGAAKLRQPYEFLSAVYAYQLVGRDLGIAIAAVLPWLEVVVGGCLLAGVLSEGSLVAAAGMCSAFASAITIDWYRGLAITCGCFGGSGETITGYAAIRSWGLLMVVLCGLLLAMRARPHPIPRQVRTRARRPEVRSALRPWKALVSRAAAPDPVYP